jgi:hypothetical protein
MSAPGNQARGQCTRRLPFLIPAPGAARRSRASGNAAAKGNNHSELSARRRCSR